MAEAGTQKIGRYEVIRSIGRGSQGAVYLAHDPVLDRLVAVKVLASSDAELNRITDDGAPLEARISSRLKHPNIIPIFDAGEWDVGPFLVFEYVEGQTLAERLKADGPMPIEVAAPLVSAVLDALSVAHAEGILHLDLSPRNLLIDSDDVPRVMDFGLAQYVSIAREPRSSAMGTLRYMTPEHFLGDPLGPWTDVFALGSTFYEVMTGIHAMQGVALEQIQANIKSGAVDFSPVRALLHGDACSSCLAGALERHRDGRYADCSVMSEAFDLFVDASDLDDSSLAAAPAHSTVEFLLRRMQRTGDFPAISRTLSDINRLTGDDQDTNADQLANVILRDYALTGKLLKLVNSAFYGTRTAEVTSISQAVVFLGLEQVRMTANSLAFFGHMKSDSSVLRDSMTKSFLAGLVARYIAQHAKLSCAEEAFICGMCQNLGENLVIFYFADEYDAITNQVSQGLDKAAASRGVLGVSYAELGAAVAKSWNLPAAIIRAIRGLPPGTIAAPETDQERLRDYSVFATELCDLFQNHDTGDVERAMRELLSRFKHSVSLDPETCERVVAAIFEKLAQFAPIFEIDVRSNGFCIAVQAWLDSRGDEATEPRRTAATR